jgi:hypothetical protein
MRDDTPMSQL